MPIAVTGDLVSCGGNPPDHLRMSIGDPAERQAGRPGVVAIEEVQQAVDVALDTTWYVIPRRAVDVVSECRDLKVVFDIDRQGISDGSRAHAASRVTSADSAARPFSQPDRCSAMRG